MSKDSKPGERASELARNIWLAGLGAYGRAWDEAQGTIQKVEKETAKLFEDLVAKGEKLEQETEQKVREVAEVSANFSIEDRLTKIRESFGFSPSAGVDTGAMESLTEEVQSLTKKVEALTGEIRKLQKQMDQ